MNQLELPLPMSARELEDIRKITKQYEIDNPPNLGRDFICVLLFWGTLYQVVIHIAALFN